VQSGEPCERVGIIAAFGGRSNLYLCTTTDQYRNEKAQCAIWADGAAYDVTKQAQALSAFKAKTLPARSAGQPPEFGVWRARLATATATTL
jgi:hypothetical protein